MSNNHPAKFHDLAIERASVILRNQSFIIDPFAGTGRCHELETAHRMVTGVEIEPEWAEMHENTITGDSRFLTRLFDPDTFDGVLTSPTYSNRMADSHNAKDASERITYTHRLGRELDPANSGKMQWGKKYRTLHMMVWNSLTRVCADGAVGVWNIKNHIRAGVEVPVVEWHIETLARNGWRLRSAEKLETTGMRRGQNHESRVDADLLIVMELKKDRGTR